MSGAVVRSLGEQALAFATEVEGLADLDAVADALLGFARRVGLSAVASGVIMPIDGEPQAIMHFAAWPEDWMERYVATGLGVDDPAPAWALRSGVPVNWDELRRLLPSRDPGRRVIAAAEEHGLSEGVVIPFRSAQGRPGLVSFAGSREALTAEETAFLRVVGAAAFDRAEVLCGRGIETLAARPRPTDRERAALQLLVQGLGDREIATKLGISVATARFHVDNVRRKLGAPSRAATAAIATALGLVRPL